MIFSAFKCQHLSLLRDSFPHPLFLKPPHPMHSLSIGFIFFSVLFMSSYFPTYVFACLLSVVLPLFPPTIIKLRWSQTCLHLWGIFRTQNNTYRDPFSALDFPYKKWGGWTKWSRSFLSGIETRVWHSDKNTRPALQPQLCGLLIVTWGGILSLPGLCVLPCWVQWYKAHKVTGPGHGRCPRIPAIAIKSTGPWCECGLLNLAHSTAAYPGSPEDPKTVPSGSRQSSNV